MTASQIISELQTLGVDLWEDSGRLRFRAPKGLLTDAHRDALRAHRDEILALLAAGRAEVEVAADPAGRHDPFPLTDVQTAYLLGRHDSFGYGGVACHGYLEFTYPELDPERVREAWRVLIDRHDMLRAVVEKDGYQHVLPEVPPLEIPVADLRGASPGKVRAELERVRADWDHRMYDTTTWPLFALRITRTDDGDVLHFSLDSLIADWASAGILLDELELLLGGWEPPRLDLTFRDYLLAERGLRDTPRYRRDRDYWRERIDDLPPAPDLPMLPPEQGTARFRRHHLRLPADRWARLRDGAAAHGLTASTAVLAAYAAVIGRWSRRRSFGLNLTLLNRMPLHPQVDRLVGDFTSVSLLAVPDPAGRPFHRHAAELGERLFADLEHRLYSGVEVVREIARRRGRDAALMPVVFTSAIGAAAGVSAGRRTGHGITQTPQVLIDCQVTDDADGLEVNWDVRQGVFPDGLVEDMFQAMATLLGDLADDPAAWERTEPVPLPAWQIAERARVNDTAAPLPGALLHEEVFAQARRTPEAIALIGAGGEMSYGELVRRAAAVAALLGCGPGEKVAVVMDKGVEQVVAVLAILLAGGVYVPVDTVQPELRRRRMLAGAGVRRVLTQSWLTPPQDVHVIAVDQVPPAAEAPDVPAGDPDALAYVIYTSGSTGDPKGVMITHRAAVNTVVDVNRRYGVDAHDRLLGVAQLGFDLSVYDVFGGLAVGAALVLPDPGRPGDPSHWADLVARHGVTLWNSVPAQLQMLAHYLESEPRPLPTLRLALLSGDWIPITLPGQTGRLLPDLSLVSLGGATEAAIWSIHHPIDGVDPSWSSIPYGVPLANQGWRVLDEAMRDAPVWTPGELYITGAGLAAGYLGDEELTAARFLAHPADGQRLYRTGDLGRYLPGGEIEFLGREDDQVKIRGHRIELGEIEAALLAHPAVGASAVVATGSGRHDRTLLGFAVPAPRGDATGDPSLERVAAAVARLADGQVEGVTADQVGAHVTALHEAALATMLHAFTERGLFGGPDDAHTAEDVLDALEVHERHRWLVRRWLHLLADAGWLAHDPASGSYTRRRDDTGPPDWDRPDAALCTPDFIGYHREHAERLDALLADEQNPFELLFPQGRQDVAHAVYRDTAISRHLNHGVAALLNRLAALRDGTLRVLEIGAGTGATTSAVVPLLDGLNVDYLFTDLTAFFLAEARERFGGQPWMRFAPFDLDRDHRAQGLVPNTADVVVCAGVLSSTRDPGAALARVAELLAPGGWLVLTEPTREHPHILLTQGFMMEPQGGDREHGAAPLLAEPRWRELIEAHGGEVVLNLPDADHPMAAEGVRLIAARFKTDRTPVTAEELSGFLAERLPAHMVPGSLQVVDGLPLTGNGKVDRKVLAGWRPAALDDTGADATPEGDDLTAKLCAMWASALAIPRIGPEENFYERGADSLVLARVTGLLREQLPEAAAFSYDALLRQMLNEPNVAALVRALRGGGPGAGTGTANVPETETPWAGRRDGSNALLIPFGGGTEGPARVMFHAALGTLDYFQHLGRGLAEQRLGPVIGVAVADTGAYLGIDPKELVGRVADDYADRLAAEGFTRFQLIGYCLGGLLATEVARRLLERGLLVEDLTLVDSIPMFIETTEELAFEAIFVPNLNLDPVTAVFGDVAAADLYRAVEKLMTEGDRVVPAGALGALTGDPGLEAVAAAARARAGIPQDERLAAYARAAAGQAGVPVDPEMVPALFRVCRHSMRAARFDPEPYVGDMRFLRATEQQSFGITGGVGHLAAPFWEETCLGEFTVTDVTGNHFSVIEPPNVTTVVEHLAAPLRTDRK